MSSDNNVNKIRVAGLNYNISHNELTSMFTRYGTLTNVDYDDNKGIAFIEFVDYDAAAFAILDLHKSMKAGRQLRVSWAKKPPANKNPNERNERNERNEQNPPKEKKDEGEVKGDVVKGDEVTGEKIETKKHEKPVTVIEMPENPIGSQVKGAAKKRQPPKKKSC